MSQKKQNFMNLRDYVPEWTQFFDYDTMEYDCSKCKYDGQIDCAECLDYGDLFEPKEELKSVENI